MLMKLRTPAISVTTCHKLIRHEGLVETLELSSFLHFFNIKLLLISKIHQFWRKRPRWEWFAQ